MRMINSLLASCLIFIVTLTPVHADTLVIGLSPFQEHEAHTAQKQALLAYACQQNTYDTIVFTDAYYLRTLGQFVIPDKTAYQSAKALLRYNAKLVKTLLQFGRDNSEDASLPTTQGAIRFPAFTQFVAQQYPDSKHLLVMGSPIYDVPVTPDFSMIGERYPSDTHILASREESVFGTAASASLLAGWSVQWINTDAVSQQSSQYLHAVTRVWHAFIAQQGGQLLRMTGDLTGALQTLDFNQVSSMSFKPLEASSPFAMLRLSDRLENQSQIQALSKNVKTSKANPAHASKASIRLRWDCEHCDLDLYVKQSNGEIVYFNHTQTAQATFYKEISSLDAANKGVETVAFMNAVDLTDLAIAVHYYNGEHPGGVSGTLTFSYDGVSVSHPFHINASHGSGRLRIDELFNTDRPSVYLLSTADVDFIRHGDSDE